MNESTKLRLKNLPISRCVICKTRRSHFNPLAKCWKCTNKYCYSHITAGVEIKGQSKSDEYKDICDLCLPKIIKAS